jgi:uncharacterized membrane protein YfcA
MDLASIGLLPAIIVLATIAIGAFMKGITGLGLPMFAIPALALFVPVESAVVIMAAPSLVANFWLVFLHRDKLPSMNRHRIFVMSGFVGALAGTWLLASINDDYLRIALAGWLGIYLLQHFTGRAKSGLFSGKAGLAGPLGFAAGSLQGATGISAPVIGPYYHAHELALSHYTVAVAFTFAVLSVAQLSAMTTVELMTPTLAIYSLLATTTTMVFMPIGVRFGKRVARETFDRIIPVLFVLIEIKLVYDIFT